MDKISNHNTSNSIKKETEEDLKTVKFS